MLGRGQKPRSNNDVFSERESSINVEDFMLSKSDAENTFDNSSWGAPSLFGLAVVCSVLGVVSSGVTSGSDDQQVANFG